MPAAYLLAALPIHGLWQEWENNAKNRLNNLFLVPLVLALGISGFINYNIYFNKQAVSSDSWAAFSTPETIAAKIMAKMGNTVDYYISTFYYHVPTIQFLAPAVTDYHRLDTYDTLPVPSDGKKGIVFLFDPISGTEFIHCRQKGTILRPLLNSSLPLMAYLYCMKYICTRRIFWHPRA